MADEAWAELGENPYKDTLIREKADFDIDRILEIEQEIATMWLHVRFRNAVKSDVGSTMV